MPGAYTIRHMQALKRHCRFASVIEISLRRSSGIMVRFQRPDHRPMEFLFLEISGFSESCWTQRKKNVNRQRNKRECNKRVE